MDCNSSIEQQFIQKLTEVIDANLHNENFGVTKLASELGMSRATLHRKVKSIVKKKVSEFIREARLNRAIDLLQQKTGTVSEIAYEVGFGSATYFSKCFHDHFGFPPGEAANHEATENEVQIKERSSKRRWVIIVSLVFSLFLIVLVLLVVVKPFSSHHKSLEKTIAVLPFIDDSPEKENNYILNGLREELMFKLTLLENITLVSRQTSDQYKDSKKKINQIGKELKANYILEGSGQTINGNTKISLHLIEAKSDRQLWSKPYEREITEDNIFDVQQEIAFLVANELGVELSPKEIARLKEMDYVNKTAYSYFLQGMNYYHIHENEKDNYEALIQAKYNIQKALKYDSSYVKAICQLGWVLHHETRFSGSRSKYDSAVLMAEKAIKLQPFYSRGHSLKGFLCQNNVSEAKTAFRNAIKYAPNDYEGYHQMGNFMCNIGEYANTVFYSLKALEVNNEPIAHNWTLINLNVSLAFTGHFKKAEEYRKEYLLQYNNKMISFNMQQCEEMMKGDYNNAVKIGLAAYKADSTDLTTLGQLGESYLFLRDFNNSEKYYKKYIERINQLSGLKFKTDSYDFAYFNNRHSNSIGVEVLPLLNLTYLFLQQNDIELFHIWSEAIIDNALKHEEYNTLWAQIHFNNLELACIYSMQNDKQKAIENLQKLTIKKICPAWLIHYLNESPMLDNIRNEPKFQKIVKVLELEYQKQYRKVNEILYNAKFTL